MKKKISISSLAIGLALLSTGAMAQFTVPPGATGGVVLPATEDFDYPDAAQLSAQFNWSVRDGADPSTIVSGSLVPSDPTVAINLAPGTGNKAHIITTTEGSSVGLFIGGGANSASGTGINQNTSVYYYSFLIEFDTDGGRNGIPFNGPIVSSRSFDNGNGVKYAVRGDNGAGGGGTNDGNDSALIVRANSSASDTAGTVELLKNDTVYFIVAKCEVADTFNTNPTDGTITLYVDPDPNDTEANATVYATATENGDYRFVRWIALDTENSNADYFIDELRIGTTWEEVTPVSANAAVSDWSMY